MESKIYQAMDWPRIEAVVYGEEASPRDVMAPRLLEGDLLVQGFFPGSRKVSVRNEKNGNVYPMEQEDEAGYFAGLLPCREIPRYSYVVEDEHGVQETCYDPYAFSCQLTEEDERAFLAGVHYEIYKKLGAHPMIVDGVEGTCFALWAPNAQRVSVVGDFNGWDGRRYPMHRMPMSGIFELFIPHIGEGENYKYEIKVRSGEVFLKCDPYGNRMEVVPGTASVVEGLNAYFWQDDHWMSQRRRRTGADQPMSIYEADLARMAKEQNVNTYEALGESLASYAKELGYTHVELHPVMEYWDEASGGYDTVGYYAPTARYGSPEAFKRLVDRLHQEEIGVILDWTPAHFPRYQSAMESLDGTPLYEAKDPVMAVHPKWGSLLYDYGSPMVKNFLIANVLYWMKEFHADGFRMDDVDAMLYLDYGREQSPWTPNMYGTNENLQAMEFLKHLNSIVKKEDSSVLLIAQEDGLWPELTDSVENDHLGFDYKWSGGWTGDFLDYLSRDPIDRKHAHDQLTLSMLYAYCERYILTLGSRDVGTFSQFLDRLPGEEGQKLATMRAAYGYLMTHPGKKMLCPDQQLPEELTAYLKELLKLYRTLPALYQMDDQPDGFEWIQLMKYEENVITFLRKTENPEETLLVICNFAAVPHENYSVGVPFLGKYKEILNSDHVKFGGQGNVNPRVKMARKEECDERSHSIKVRVPALGCCIFTCTQTVEQMVDNQTAKAAKPQKGTGKSLKASILQQMEENETKTGTWKEQKKGKERKA